MNMWNNFLRLFLANLVIIPLGITTLSAQDLCLPCYDTCSFGGFEFGVDFIYWKPCLDDLNYGAAGTFTNNCMRALTSDNQLKYQSISPDWEPGFRIRGGKTDIWCRWMAILSYTQLNPKSTGSGPTLCNTLLHPQFDNVISYTHSSAKWNSKYQTWDALLGFPITFSDRQTLTPTFGVAGLILDQHLKSTVTDPNLTDDSFANTRWYSNYWGAGLKIGTDYELHLCKGWKILAAISGTLVAGDISNTNSQKSEIGQPAQVTKLHFNDDTNCHIISGYHLLAGIEYSSYICQRHVDFHIGYEFVEWFSVPSARRFITNTSNNEKENARSIPNCTATLGFHGLFAGLKMQF